QRANRRATAVIYVEYEDGSVATATAFAVQSEGVLLTNRHAVLGADGQHRPRRIALQFCDSEQIFPARLLATADAADLAAVAVEKLEGTIPVVRGLNVRADTLPAEAPVALIGFPLGGDQPLPGLGGGAAVVRPIVGAGVVRALRSDRLELTGYGAEGASGSPIFDGAGEVVGILYGGTESASGQTLYAVPASVAARLLDVLRRRGST
ncbi:MAG TPA: trypsin-like peptidase domain-containing protein, partial [Longimicrobiales bacterium]